MIELTVDQQRILAENGWPPRVRNPGTKEIYVLIPEPMFERARKLLEEEEDIAAVEEMYPLVSEALESDEPSSRESA